MIHVYTDGASAGNPGPSGAGIVIVEKARPAVEYRYHLGEISNHEAEFVALDIALSICLKKGFKQVSARTDSKVVSDSVEKGFVKNKEYSAHLKNIMAKMELLDLFFIKWIPSKQNKKADELARLAIREPKRIYE